MKLKFNALVAAAAFVAAGGAQAALSYPGGTSFGNSSLLFVALDTTASIAFSADLGLNMIDFLQGAPRTTLGTVINWNFNTNTSSDAAVTGNSWSGAFATFLGTATAANVRWGVVASDSIQGSGSTVTALNAIAGRGWLATGNVTVAQMTAANTSGPTGTGLGATTNFYPATANLPGSTFISANNGAGTATSGEAYGAMFGTFGGGSTWNYLVANGVTSTFQRQQQVIANPFVFQIGALASLDNALNDTPATFTFDLASSTLVYAVPEPGTYAMLLAGLAAVGFMVRRRNRGA